MVAVVASIMVSCSTTYPIAITNNTMGGKVGVAKNNCLSYAPMVPMPGQSEFIPVSGGMCFNDRKYGIAEAAMNGGITKVATVDMKVTNYVIYYKYELIVTGE